MHTAQECEALARGEAADIDAIHEWAVRHLCFNHETCNHDGCSKTQSIIDWIANQATVGV